MSKTKKKFTVNVNATRYELTKAEVIIRDSDSGNMGYSHPCIMLAFTTDKNTWDKTAEIRIEFQRGIAKEGEPETDSLFETNVKWGHSYCPHVEMFSHSCKITTNGHIFETRDLIAIKAMKAIGNAIDEYNLRTVTQDELAQFFYAIEKLNYYRPERYYQHRNGNKLHWSEYCKTRREEREEQEKRNAA
jgi:hypothetical protein